MHFIILTLLVLLVFPATNFASEISQSHARALLKSGEIMSLQDLLSRAEGEVLGKIIEVELHETSNGYNYEIEWLDVQGNVWEFYFDAKTGQLLKKRLDD